MIFFLSLEQWTLSALVLSVRSFALTTSSSANLVLVTTGPRATTLRVLSSSTLCWSVHFISQHTFFMLIFFILFAGYCAQRGRVLRCSPGLSDHSLSRWWYWFWYGNFVDLQGISSFYIFNLVFDNRSAKNTPTA